MTQRFFVFAAALGLALGVAFSSLAYVEAG